MTFWGTEYFKSSLDKEVRYGETISHKIFRQIGIGASKQIDSLHTTTDTFGAFGILLILPLVTVGSLLPTWMFINALSLIAHLPLLNSNMPANAHYFLRKYLDILRWYHEDTVEQVEDYFEIKKYDDEVGHFHLLLKACGYEHLLAHNLLLVFLACLLILFVWMCLGVKDLIGMLSKSERPFMKKRHERICNNFALRFFYEFFLEFCIVVLINMSVMDFSEVSPTLSYVVSAVLATLIVVLFALVITLLFCKGPYVDGYYKKGTALTHTWGRRPINPEFDSFGYLKANRKKFKKPKGWFRFILGAKKPPGEDDLPKGDLEG